MTNHTPMKLRTVRCIATGKITSQSSSKTKELLKRGGYVEVTPGYAVHVVSPAGPKTPPLWFRVVVRGGLGAVALGIIAWLLT